MNEHSLTFLWLSVFRSRHEDCLEDPSIFGENLNLGSLFVASLLFLGRVLGGWLLPLYELFSVDSDQLNKEEHV